MSSARVLPLDLWVQHPEFVSTSERWLSAHPWEQQLVEHAILAMGEGRPFSANDVMERVGRDVVPENTPGIVMGRMRRLGLLRATGARVRSSSPSGKGRTICVFELVGGAA